ncbi:MAG: NUDIX hydrolase [Hyphomonadaceae bacterium]
MTKMRNGPWMVHDTEMSFENPWLKVESSNITHPDGSAGTYGVVRFANIACGVLPIDDEGHTWLVGQHRFPFDSYSWELPEGGGPIGIDPQVSTARELQEETGLVASEYMPLGRWHLSNSVSDEVAFGYLAWGLTLGEAAPEPSEALDIRRVPVFELIERVRSGAITDAFTHLMVMSALDMARRGEVPEHIAGFLRDG